MNKTKSLHISFPIMFILTMLLSVLPSCKAGTGEDTYKESNKETNADTNITILKNKAVPNPTGLQFGFWANFNKQDGVLKDFGKRPVGRVDFTGWDSYETRKGVYDWTNAFKNIKKSHVYGESVVTCVNISFSKEITNEKSTIPDFYYPSNYPYSSRY